MDKYDGVICAAGKEEDVDAAQAAIVAELCVGGEAETFGQMPSSATLYRARFTGVQFDVAERVASLAARYPTVDVGALFELRGPKVTCGFRVFEKGREVIDETGGEGDSMSPFAFSRLKVFA